MRARGRQARLAMAGTSHTRSLRLRTPSAVMLLPILCLLLHVANGSAQNSELSIESGVKAAFVLNFVKFVEWPPETFLTPDTPIKVCVLRQSRFGETLERAARGQLIEGRSVIVLQISTPDAASTAMCCSFPRPSSTRMGGLPCRPRADC